MKYYWENCLDHLYPNIPCSYELHQLPQMSDNEIEDMRDTYPTYEFRQFQMCQNGNSVGYISDELGEQWMEEGLNAGQHCYRHV